MINYANISFQINYINMKKLIISLLLSFPALTNSQTIAIDIGHSNKKPGAISTYGKTEFLYNKELGYLTALEISKQYKVNLIGYNGNMEQLSDRVKLAENSNLFISIHHDSVQEQDLTTQVVNGITYKYTTKAKGYSIFISSKNPHFELTYKCATSISNSLQKYGFTPNHYHNLPIKGESKEFYNKDLAIYKYDNLFVLKNNTIPALLIEAGVIVHPEEAKWLEEKSTQLKFSQAVSSGIMQCLTKPN